MDTISSYTVSIHYDRRLYRQDIAGSMAHARMLARQGIITDEARDAILAAWRRSGRRSRTAASPGAKSSKTST